MNLFKRFLRALCGAEDSEIQQLKIMSAAIDNLKTAVARNTASVDAAVAILITPRISETDVQVAADAVNANSDRLDGAVNPPAATVATP